MDDLIEKIRAATVTDATDDARAAGADACRTLLIALETKAGEPMASSPASSESTLVPTPIAPATQTPSPHVTAHAIGSALRGMTLDQLLDVAIVRLRAALPPGTSVPVTQSTRIPLVPINQAVRS